MILQRAYSTCAFVDDGHAAQHGLIIATLVLFLVGAVFYFVRPRHESPVPTAHASIAPIHVRRSVAVLSFRNLPGRPEDNWLSAAFSEMLNTELVAGGELRMVSGEDVTRIENDLPLSGEDSLSKSTLQRLRANPGADVVILGSYMMLPNDPDRKIRLDVRLPRLKLDAVSHRNHTAHFYVVAGTDLFSGHRTRRGG